jgi:pyruvoyl-dependent arginine decarboxylase (PvlArgDC)
MIKVAFIRFIFNKKISMIPKKVFFTKGVGVHKDQLASFELALRQA